MKNWELIFSTLFLLILGGSTILVGLPLENGATSEFSQIGQPLREGEDVSQDSTNADSLVEISSISPTLSIQSDFPEPSIEVLQFTDHAMDLRGYGNDTLRFNMQFKPAQRASYYGYARICANNASITPLTAEFSWSAWVDPETITVASFDISGYEIREQLSDGPYLVHLRFYKNNGSTSTIYDEILTQVDNPTLNYTTLPYLATDFRIDPVTVNGYTITMIDNDVNGKYEWIEVNYDLTVEIPGNYEIYGNIRQTTFGTSDESKIRPYLNMGNQIITMRFCGWDFRNIVNNDTLSLNTWIEHDDHPTYRFYDQSNAYTTPVDYWPGEFDNPPINLTGRAWNTGIDTNGDGDYNYLRVIVEIDRLRVESVGYYRLRSNLRVNSTYSSITDYWNDNPSNIPLTQLSPINVTFEFNGIHINKELASYVSEELLVKMDSGYYSYPGDSYSDYYYPPQNVLITEAYNSTQFDGPGAELTDYFTDYGLDTDGDLLFNLYIVEVGINVMKAGRYYIDGAIDTVSDTYNFVSAGNTSDLTVGPHILQLRFDGTACFERTLSDNFRLSHINLNQEPAWTNIDSNDSVILSYYVFTQFDPPKARLTGIFSDSTAGLPYTELIIYVEVEINSTGRYRMEGTLKNTETGETTSVTTEPKNYLTIGTFSEPLSFSGSWVWAQHANRTYLLSSVSIYECTETGNHIRTWDSLSYAFTTDTIYDSDDFIHPPVYFTGNFSESLKDLDSNGFPEFLIISAEVNVSINYSVQIEFGGYIDDTSSWQHNYTGYLDPGISWIDLRFPVFELETKKLVSHSYSVQLRLRWYREEPYYNWETGDNLPDYQTNLYDHWQFEVPGVEFTGNIYDYGVDTNTNSLFNYIELAFEVKVNTSGDYRFYGSLYNRAGGGNSYYFTTGTITLSNSVWYQNVTVEIDRHWFLDYPNGSQVYIGYFRIYQNIETYGEIELFYDGTDRDLSNIYYYDILDLPVARFTGNVFDYGVDTDANNRFDFINISIEVQINEPGEYRVDTQINAVDSGNGYGFGSYLLDLTVGVYNFTFQLPGNWIRSQPNGTDFYLPYMRIYQYIENKGDVQRQYNDTDRYLSSYQHTDFDLPDAYVIGILADYLVEITNDTYYDYWNVVFQVNVTVPQIERIELWAEVNDNETLNPITSEYVNVYSLPFGLHNVTLEFEGHRFNKSGFTQGAYINRYRLHGTTSDFGWTLLSESWDDIPLFAANNSTQFPYDPPNFIKIYSINPSDEIFERNEEIYVQVTIEKFGYADVQHVSVSAYIDGSYLRNWELYKTNDGNPYETWAVTIRVEKGGMWLLDVYAQDNYGRGDWENVSFYVLGGPVFFGFTANTSSVMLNETVHFEADVWDEDGIRNLTLLIEGGSLSYPLSYVGNASIGELWTVDVTFNTIGQYSVYIVGVDMNGTSSQSDSLTIYVNEGPRIIAVEVSPGKSVDIGTEVEFTVIVERTTAIITSVTLEVEDSDGIRSLVALEEVDSDSTTLIYSGSFTPKKSGRHVCTIIVLTTMNQQSSHEVILNVTGSPEDLQIAPGFELLAVLGVLIGFPVARKKYKK